VQYVSMFEVTDGFLVDCSISNFLIEASVALSTCYSMSLHLVQ